MTPEERDRIDAERALVEPVSTVQLVAWMAGKTPEEVEQALADALDQALGTD